MKILFIIKKFLPQLSLIFLLILQSFHPSIVIAQQQDSTVNKGKLKKITRVFYGMASFYSNKFNGRKTANGEIYSQKKLTCACNVLPLGTWIRVTNLRNNHTVEVKVNDRIHPKMRRVVDLTRAAAEKLDFISQGLTRVKVEVLGRK